MKYSQLREALPAQLSISTLGGRQEIEIHNLACGHLTVINSKGSAYTITEADWHNAQIIRSRNPRNPWASKHYTGLSAFTSYGLTHAAALLRHLEENHFDYTESLASGTLIEAQ